MKVNYVQCINNVKGIEKLEDSSVTLTLTSPPYDKLRVYEGFNFDFQALAKEIFRVTADGGTLVWVTADATVKGSETGTSFRQALFLMECGFKLYDTMIWNKTSILPLNHKRYEQAFEYMFVLVKGKIKTFNGIRTAYAESTIARFESGKSFWNTHRHGRPNEKSIKSKQRVLRSDGVLSRNVWTIAPDIKLKNEDKYLLDHPARFPEELAEKHIATWSNEGDLIFDPFGGSGTTGAVAKRMKRNFILFDTSMKYVVMSRKRIASVESE